MDNGKWGSVLEGVPARFARGAGSIGGASGARRRVLSCPVCGLDGADCLAGPNAVAECSPHRCTQVEGREAIERKFQFADFSEAWAFMSRSALAAEEVSRRALLLSTEGRVALTGPFVQSGRGFVRRGTAGP